jgi:hypothetical protein
MFHAIKVPKYKRSYVHAFMNFASLVNVICIYMCIYTYIHI